MQHTQFSLQSLIPKSLRNRFKRLDLRGKLTLGNMAITLLVVIIMGIYLYSRIQDASQELIARVESNTRTRAEEDLVNTIREQSNLLESFFYNLSNNTSIAADAVQGILEDQSLATTSEWDAITNLNQLPTGSWDNDNNEITSIFIPAGVDLTNPIVRKINNLKYAELIFPSILNSNPDIVAIYFGGSNKETIYYPNIDLANIVPADFDVTGRQWYLAATPENNPQNLLVWSAPYEDAALNGLVITTSKPVFSRGSRFQGVTAMDVQITRIIELVSKIQVGETGYAFIIDNQNRIISLPQSGLSDFKITDENATLSSIIDPSVLTSAAPELFEVLQETSTQNSGLLTLNINGIEKHVVYQSIAQVNYKLVFILPSSELFADRAVLSEQIARETNTTINVSLLLIGIIFLIAGLATYGFSNRFTAPLKSLNNAANEIIRGNFNTHISIRSGDELESFGITLNTMTDTVKDLISSLERRVTERTSDLQNAIQDGERRSKQYEAIARVAQAIGSRQNLRDLLPQVTRVISEQFGFYHVGIFLNDAMNKYAILAAANSEGGQRMLNRGHQLMIGTQGIVGYATGTKKPRIALSVGQDAVYFNNPDLPETQSEMALPLIESEQVLGALDVQSREANAFSDNDVEVLAILAELVSIAIQNAKLNEQIDRSLAEAEAASRQYFRENWNRLAEQNKITGYRYTAGGSVALSPTTEPEYEKTNHKQVTVPITIRGEEIGELSILIPKEENIKTDQMDMVKAVADRVAVIAENARLFDETTKRAERERLVTDITTKIRGSNDPQTMIETAINELRTALKVSRVEVIPQKKRAQDQ